MDLPEITALRRPESVVRIPDRQDVPITPRVRRILDTAPVRRLASISQLGMVALVYPGATHSRWEHSLGVYHYGLKLLDRFSVDDRFADPAVGEAFLLATLLHDVGHWPFCHPIEDMQLGGLSRHEDHAALWMNDAEIVQAFDQDWRCTPDQVMGFLTGRHGDAWADDDACRFLTSCLSGPIDVDKLDYLQRDSWHAGVPYGRNFDADRLVHSMVVHPERPELAIHQKGRTAAEMMVFARYVMFSEVYWHHAVRSATAMLQRCVFLLQNRVDLESSFRMDDATWIAMIRRMAAGSMAEPLAEGLFGPRRCLHKRLAQFDVIEGESLHCRLARRPYWWLVAAAENLARLMSTETGLAVHASDVLIDAPPVKLEVDINIDIVDDDDQVRPLGRLSPVASVLANRQFDRHVKRVRLFVRPDLKTPLMRSLDSPEAVEGLVARAIDQAEKEIV
ncbi:HD domain-containing protein [Crateriforma conspicua]|uniref:HD/PDEase domain-containing protein n=1 Tax=Crateriforma conspicua TaxID=2527996 RepID=A0A5C5Y184_9PLAN|nr:HD domain-containing protein [Crateriforma conspicua]QDV62837.1 hypothetical protein Mal65_19740 [Crateriforma conspicua]TWT68391.1 hypothetical protein Pan14r_06350 [Crateriforma conspicua]